MSRRPWGTATFSLAAALLLTAGCASQPPGAPGDSVDYLCGSDRVSSEMLEEPTRIADLDADSRAAIEGATFDDGSVLDVADPEAWQVIADEDDEIVLIRPVDDGELQIGDFGEGMRTDHELLVLTTDLWPGWAVGAQSSCALTVDLGGLGVPFIALDPAAPASADASSLSLLVLDPSCGGDTDMPGRIEVVSIDQTETEVRLLLGVQPLPHGAYDCPGFPPTPFMVELDEPLGDRTIIDASRAIRRELSP